MAKAIHVGVSGVAKKVKQPFVGVDGVARKVKNAFVGVSGVARQCFSSGIKVPISVGPVYEEAMAYVTINGTTYGKTGNKSYNVEVPIGTTIQCFVKTYTAMSIGFESTRANIYLNGTVVAYTGSMSGTTYNYVVKGNVSISMKYTTTNLAGMSVMLGQIYITES